jgi:DNA-binding NarL/FixJ family response regulator
MLLLDAEPDFKVVAQAGDILWTRTCVRQHAPDVMVLDLNMPGESPIGAIAGLREQAP